jgi:hypothetical protein
VSIRRRGVAWSVVCRFRPGWRTGSRRASGRPVRSIVEPSRGLLGDLELRGAAGLLLRDRGPASWSRRKAQYLGVYYIGAVRHIGIIGKAVECEVREGECDKCDGTVDD